MLLLSPVFKLEFEHDVSIMVQSVDDVKWNRAKTTSNGVNNSIRKMSRLNAALMRMSQHR
jgi:hypothetical protein